jgi:hypothetical protein
VTTLSLAEVRRIADARAPWCVTIYGDADAWLGSSRPSEAAERQIQLAARVTMDAAAAEHVVATVRDRLRSAGPSLGRAAVLLAHRVRSVGIFVTSEECDVFALTTMPRSEVTVSDRFDVAALAEAALALTPRVFVLAASENSARLVDVTAHPARVIDLAGLPAHPGIEREVDSTNGDRVTWGSRLPDEGTNRSRAYAESLIRQVVPVVHEAGAMLAIAAAEPLASMLEADVILYSVVPSQILPSVPGLAPPAELSAAQLADLAAPIVDEQEERARLAEISLLSEEDALLTLRDIASVEADLQDSSAATLFMDVEKPASDAATE